MVRTRTLGFASHLARPADEVWAHATSMRGVNEELSPWLRMTYPKGFDDLAASVLQRGGAPPEEPLFTSWILALGGFPAERWRLRIVALGPERRFVEESRVLTLSLWRHERSVAPEADGGCTLRDTLTFAPRLALALAPVTALVRALFTRRHAFLRRRFGEARSAA